MLEQGTVHASFFLQQKSKLRTRTVKHAAGALLGICARLTLSYSMSEMQIQ